MTKRKAAKPTPKPKSKPKKPPARPKTPPGNTDHLDASMLDPSVPLPDARQERFCQLLTNTGMSNGQAYLLAGYAVKDVAVGSASANRLLKDLKVQSRVTFLQNRAAAMAIDGAQLSKADVLNLTLEQHQRNIGVRPVQVTVKVKTGKDKGKTYVEERIVYNEHAASQTLKLLNDEYGLGQGGSGNRGDDLGGIDARAGREDPGILEDLNRLGSVRKMVMAGAGTIEGAARPGEAMAQLKKVAEGK